MKTKKASRAAKPVRRARRTRRDMPVHKRFALHPINLLFLLCMGVLLCQWTLHTSADSFTVSATVPAPALTQPAVITSPTDGQTFSATPITVSGTCPTNSYIILTNNGTASGEAGCTSGGAFAIQAGLYNGENVLNAQDYNITNSPGPTSPNVTVTYTPAPGSTSPSGGGGGGGTATVSGSVGSNGSSGSVSTTSSGTPPLLLSSNFTFQTFSSGSNFMTNIVLEGGTPPYTLYINWGDGTNSVQVIPNDPTFQISHVYKNPGYYPILIKAVDAKGAVQYLQLAAFIHAPNSAYFQAPTSTGGSHPRSLTGKIGNFLSHTKDWLIFIWPSYLVVLLMVFSFWLGERQEFQLLSRPKRNKSRAYAGRR